MKPAFSVSTPLGPSVAITALTADEGISKPFNYQLELAIANSEKDVFDRLLGQALTVSLAPAGDRARFFSGVCTRLVEGARAASTTSFEAQLSPMTWSLAADQQSRVFQHLSVPDILRLVLGRTTFEMQLTGAYPVRDYCVQYRESDFAFASRLMEEEGIYYFFKHADGAHTLVISDSSPGAAPIPGAATAVFGNPGHERVSSWRKSQALTAGRTTLRDSNFQLPGQHLEATQPIASSVPAGRVIHHLDIANDHVEIFDFPGGYAKWFDGVSPAGGDQSSELQHIFTENKRVALVRMQEVAAGAVTIQGASGSSNFVPGAKFSLTGHPDADGQYVLTAVQHSVVQTGQSALQYHNTFQCLPLPAPFRPPRTTPRPILAGPQTAVVTGPPGETTFTDRYGRVKVKFQWDRSAQSDENSSCWVRVGSVGPAGGAVLVPRIGEEVVVAFVEGDPDRPIVVGSVFNPDHLPPNAGPPTSPSPGTT